jgi:hypothetical protein
MSKSSNLDKFDQLELWLNMLKNGFGTPKPREYRKKRVLNKRNRKMKK